MDSDDDFPIEFTNKHLRISLTDLFEALIKINTNRIIVFHVVLLIKMIF